MHFFVYGPSLVVKFIVSFVTLNVLLLSGGCLCFVSPPRDAMGWSVICSGVSRAGSGGSLEPYSCPPFLNIL